MVHHELLAPAGSLDICKAVLAAGADAVYLGGEKYGARAFAKNFTQNDILEALDYAHLHGKKIFLTVNTLLVSIRFILFGNIGLAPGASMSLS